MRLDEANPQILVPGIGMMSLAHAVRRVNEMLEDLHDRATGPVTQGNWHTIDVLIDRGTLQTYIKAIAKALQEG